jgi:hypothetical protein
MSEWAVIVGGVPLTVNVRCERLATGASHVGVAIDLTADILTVQTDGPENLRPTKGAP